MRYFPFEMNQMLPSPGKKYFLLLRQIFLLFLFLFCHSAISVYAAPQQVILYPSGATVFELATIPQDDEMATLLLPHVAIPESLQVSLRQVTDGEKIVAVESRSVLQEVTDFRQLKDLIARLEREIAALHDQIQSRNLSLNFWKKSAELPVETLADARKAGQMIRQESILLFQEISSLKRHQFDLETQLKEARDQLQQKTGNNRRQWQIQVRLSRLAATDIKLAYSYRVRRARWQPSYVLNALPGNKRVDWTWTAKINQQTGIDWDGVDLQIATAEPVFTLNPPSIKPWNINENKGLRRNKRAKIMAAPQLDAVAMVGAELPQYSPVPIRKQGQLFDTYELGRVTVLSGIESRVKIREGSWRAAFTYLSRPQLSEQVFLEANLDSGGDFLPLPSGSASIQVDGVHVGRRSFSLYEKHDIRMSFGSDPGIVADVQTDHVAGEKGLLTTKKTYDWNWTVTFINHKDFPVELRVEDSIPHVGHKNIVMTELFSSPVPEKEDDRTLSWQLSLPAQGKKQIQYGYKVKYPEDMQISLGR